MGLRKVRSIASASLQHANSATRAFRQTQSTPDRSTPDGWTMPREVGWLHITPWADSEPLATLPPLHRSSYPRKGAGSAASSSRAMAASRPVSDFDERTPNHEVRP